MSFAPSEGESFHSSVISATNSPQFINLSKFIADLDKQKKNKTPVTPQKMSKLQILTDQLIETLGDKGQGELFPLLSRSLGILAKNTPSKQISHLAQENSKLKQELSDALEENSRLSLLQEQTPNTKEYFKQTDKKYAAIVEGLKKKIGDQEEILNQYSREIEMMNEERMKLHSRNQKQKDKIIKLEDLIYDTDERVKQLTQQLEELENKKKNDSLVCQEKDILAEENKQMKVHNKKLLVLIDQQNGRFKEQIAEIQKLYQVRHTLCQLTSKLLALVDFYENNAKTSTTLNDQYCLNQNSCEEIDSILKWCRETFADNQGIQSVLNQEKIKAEEKITKIFEVLAKTQSTIIQDKEQKNELINQNLSAALFSLLKFLSQLTNCKEMQNLIISAPQKDNLRKELISSSQKIEKFIKDNSIELEETQSAFSYLLPLESVEQSDSYLSQYFKQVQERSDPFVSELVAFTSQCVVANEILRKYSMKIKDITSNQTILINKLQKEQQNKIQEYDLSQKSMSEKIHLLSKERTKLQKALFKCKKLSNGTVIYEQISDLYDAVVPEQSEINQTEIYIEKLERRVKSQKIKFNKAISQYETIISQLQNKTVSIEKQLFECQKTKESTNEMPSELKEKEGIMLSISDENKLLKTKIQEIELAQNKETEQTTKKLTQLTLQLTQVRNVIMQVRNIFGTIINENNQKLQVINHILKKYHKEYTSYLSNLKSMVMSIVNNKHSDLKKIQVEFDKSKLNENQLITENNKLQEQLKIEQNKISKISIMNNSANLKLKSVEEKCQRDLALQKKQLEFQLHSKEIDASQRIERIKEESQQQIQGIVLKIVHSFREYFDFNQQISIDCLDKIIAQIKEKFKQKSCDHNENEINKREMEQIKNFLALSPKDSTINKLRQLKTECEENAAKINILSDDNCRMKQEIAKCRSSCNAQINLDEWTEWAKQLIVFSFGSNEIESDQKKQMETLGDIIKASINAESTIRKMQLLRDEKVIIEKGIAKDSNMRKKKITFSSMVTFAKAIVFIQRISCHCYNRMNVGNN